MADREMWAVRDAKGEILALVDTKEEAEREMDAHEHYFDGVEKPMSVSLERVPREADCDWSPEDEEAAKEAEQERQAERFKHRMKQRILEYLDEYQCEGEHQDGYGYWDNFQTIGQAIQDFGRFLQETEEGIDSE